MNDSASIDSDAFGRPRRWLVVDDEPEMSELIADLLAQMSCSQVESFTSSPDALAAFSAQAGDFELVVTDRDMPHLDGMELSRQLLSESPHVKVILVSANTDDLSVEDLRRAGVHAVVKKPFTLAWLEAVVRELTLSRLCEAAPAFAHAA